MHFIHSLWNFQIPLEWKQNQAKSMLTFKLHVHCRGMGNHISWQPTCLILEVLKYIILWLSYLFKELLIKIVQVFFVIF